MTHAGIQLTEQGSPANPIFNRGVGTFQVRWVANTNWAEGTGTPGAPTTDGISYGSEAGLLNSNTDEVLGHVYQFRDRIKLWLFYLRDAAGSRERRKEAGAESGSLFHHPYSPNTGFTFDSREFGNNTDWPFLEIAAIPQAAIIGVHPSGSNIVLTCTNGAAGQTYYTLMNTNLGAPLNQWSPMATNHLSKGGNFTITVTKGAAGPSSQYFTHQAQ